MRKNYDRIKQRIKISSPDSTFRVTDSLRHSIAFNKTSYTQRTNRYKTECAEEEIERDTIPRMLLG
jgi:hypothetical protein